MSASTRGEYSEESAALMRASMPRKGYVSRRYEFGRYRRGTAVRFEGQPWRVYDADADCAAPQGFTLLLLSPDCRRWIRGVRTDELDVQP